MAVKVDSLIRASHQTSDSHRRTPQVTGLGLIACLAIAIGSLVCEGTLPFTNYLVFLAFLLVGAGGLVWRMLTPGPVQRNNFGRMQHTGRPGQE